VLLYCQRMNISQSPGKKRRPTYGAISLIIEYMGFRVWLFGADKDIEWPELEDWLEGGRELAGDHARLKSWALSAS
jgi:hypothetical protein